MTYILGRLQLKYAATSIPRFIEIMSNAKKGLEATGWQLEGSFSSSSGRIYEVLDLWKVEGYDKAQKVFLPSLLAGLTNLLKLLKLSILKL